MTPSGEREGAPPLPRSRTGKLAVIAIIVFALAFAVGGFFAVKAITAGRGAQGPGPPSGEAPKAPPKG